MAPHDWPVHRFRELLDRILEKTGRSQVALAALVPMDQSQFSRWKSGASRPKYESLAAFADAIEREFPHIGITRREILAAGGYGDTLPPNAGPIKVPSDTPPPAVDPYRDPGDLPPHIDLTALEPWEAQILSALTELTPHERQMVLVYVQAMRQLPQIAEADSLQEGRQSG